MNHPTIRRWKRWVSHGLVAFPLVSALAFLAYRRWAPEPLPARDSSPQSVVLAVGEPVPAIIVTDAAGANTSFDRVLGGRAAMVIVVHPSCDHCHTEVLAAAALRDAAPAKAVGWLVISVGGVEETGAFRERYPEFTVYRDAEGALQERYGLTTVPVTWSVDPTGTIRGVRFGADRAALRTQYEEIASL